MIKAIQLNYNDVWKAMQVRGARRNRKRSEDEEEEERRRKIFTFVLN